MSWLRNAWTAASRAQKLVILIALLVSLGSLPGLTSPAPLPPPAEPPVAAGVTFLATGVDLSPRAPESAAPALTASPPTPFATPTPTATPSPTPTPMRTPSATPTPRPTPRRTPAPTLIAKPSIRLSLAFRSLTSPVHRGSNATASVHTAAGAQCDIEVEYKSGSSTAAGLLPKDADSAGNVSWTWKVGTRTTPGSWPVIVTCSKAGQTRSVTKDFQVI